MVMVMMFYKEPHMNGSKCHAGLAEGEYSVVHTSEITAHHNLICFPMDLKFKTSFTNVTNLVPRKGAPVPHSLAVGNTSTWLEIKQEEKASAYLAGTASGRASTR